MDVATLLHGIPLSTKFRVLLPGWPCERRPGKKPPCSSSRYAAVESAPPHTPANSKPPTPSTQLIPRLQQQQRSIFEPSGPQHPGHGASEPLPKAPRRQSAGSAQGPTPQLHGPSHPGVLELDQAPGAAPATSLAAPPPSVVGPAGVAPQLGTPPAPPAIRHPTATPTANPTSANADSSSQQLPGSLRTSLLGHVRNADVDSWASIVRQYGEVLDGVFAADALFRAAHFVNVEGVLVAAGDRTRTRDPAAGPRTAAAAALHTQRDPDTRAGPGAGATVPPGDQASSHDAATPPAPTITTGADAANTAPGAAPAGVTPHSAVRVTAAAGSSSPPRPPPLPPLRPSEFVGLVSTLLPRAAEDAAEGRLDTVRACRLLWALGKMAECEERLQVSQPGSGGSGCAEQKHGAPVVAGTRSGPEAGSGCGDGGFPSGKTSAMGLYGGPCAVVLAKQLVRDLGDGGQGWRGVGSRAGGRGARRDDVGKNSRPRDGGGTDGGAAHGAESADTGGDGVGVGGKSDLRPDAAAIGPLLPTAGGPTTCATPGSLPEPAPGASPRQVVMAMWGLARMTAAGHVRHSNTVMHGGGPTEEEEEEDDEEEEEWSDDDEGEEGVDEEEGEEEEGDTAKDASSRRTSRSHSSSNNNGKSRGSSNSDSTRLAIPNSGGPSAAQTCGGSAAIRVEPGKAEGDNPNGGDGDGQSSNQDPDPGISDLSPSPDSPSTTVPAPASSSSACTDVRLWDELCWALRPRLHGLSPRELSNALWALAAVKRGCHPVFQALVSAMEPYLAATVAAAAAVPTGGHEAGGGAAVSRAVMAPSAPPRVAALQEAAAAPAPDAAAAPPLLPSRPAVAPLPGLKAGAATGVALLQRPVAVAAGPVSRPAARVEALDLANTVWALAKARIDRTARVLRLAEAAVLCLLHTLDTQHVASLLWSFATLRFRPSRPTALPAAAMAAVASTPMAAAAAGDVRDPNSQGGSGDNGTAGASAWGGGGGRNGGGGTQAVGTSQPMGLFELLAARAGEVQLLWRANEGFVAQMVWALVRRGLASELLLGTAAQRLAVGAERLSLREVAMVASAYHEARFAHPLLFRALRRRVVSLPWGQLAEDPGADVSIALVLRALAWAGAYRQPVYTRLCDALTCHLGTIQPQSLAMALRALATAQHRKGQFLTAATLAATAIVGSFRGGELSSVALSLALLGVRDTCFFNSAAVTLTRQNGRRMAPGAAAQRPGRRPTTRGGRRYWLDKVKDAHRRDCWRLVDLLNPQELANLMAAFALAGHVDEVLYGRAQVRAQRLLNASSVIRRQAAAAAAGTAARTAPTVTAAAAVAALQRGDPVAGCDFSAAAGAKLLWAFVSLGADGPQLLRDLAGRLRQQASRMQPRDIAALAWSLATARLGPDCDTLLLQCVRAAAQHAGGFSPAELAAVAWAAASVGYLDRALMAVSAAAVLRSPAPRRYATRHRGSDEGGWSDTRGWRRRVRLEADSGAALVYGGVGDYDGDGDTVKAAEAAAAEAVGRDGQMYPYSRPTSLLPRARAVPVSLRVLAEVAWAHARLRLFNPPLLSRTAHVATVHMSAALATSAGADAVDAADGGCDSGDDGGDDGGGGGSGDGCGTGIVAGRFEVGEVVLLLEAFAVWAVVRSPQGPHSHRVHHSGAHPAGDVGFRNSGGGGRDGSRNSSSGSGWCCYHDGLFRAACRVLLARLDELQDEEVVGAAWSCGAVLHHVAAAAGAQGRQRQLLHKQGQRQRQPQQQQGHAQPAVAGGGDVAAAEKDGSQRQSSENQQEEEAEVQQGGPAPDCPHPHRHPVVLLLAALGSRLAAMPPESLPRQEVLQLAQAEALAAGFWAATAHLGSPVEGPRAGGAASAAAGGDGGGGEGASGTWLQHEQKHEDATTVISTGGSCSSDSLTCTPVRGPPLQLPGPLRARVAGVWQAAPEPHMRRAVVELCAALTELGFRDVQINDRTEDGRVPVDVAAWAPAAGPVPARHQHQHPGEAVLTSSLAAAALASGARAGGAAMGVTGGGGGQGQGRGFAERVRYGFVFAPPEARAVDLADVLCGSLGARVQALQARGWRVVVLPWNVGAASGGETGGGGDGGDGGDSGCDQGQRVGFAAEGASGGEVASTVEAQRQPQQRSQWQQQSQRQPEVGVGGGGWQHARDVRQRVRAALRAALSSPGY